MPTPDASQYTQFKRFAAVGADFSSGEPQKQLIYGNNSHVNVPLSASALLTFLPSDQKINKFAADTFNTLYNGITSSVFMPAAGGYTLYQFTAPYSGDYAFTLNFPNIDPLHNDLDLFVSSPNIALDIPTIVAWENLEILVGSPSPSVQYKGTSSGLESFTGTLQAGAVYQIMVYTYYADNPSTYDLTVSFLPPPPSFPSSVRAVARDASAQVTWDRPSYLGSSPLSYLVTTYANDN